MPNMEDLRLEKRRNGAQDRTTGTLALSYCLFEWQQISDFLRNSAQAAGAKKPKLWHGFQTMPQLFSDAGDHVGFFPARNAALADQLRQRPVIADEVVRAAR